jgi:lipid II:glycine glycyltransferase (peptidoglycan interpeptide bridge formation enzyme)
MTYYRKKKIVKIAEIWYNCQERPEQKHDVFKYKFVDQKQKNAVLVEGRYTILINLRESEEILFANIGKNTRYKINRAKERDRILCSTFLKANEKNEGKIARYIHFFNEFSSTKDRSSIDFLDIEQFYNNETFCIRCAADTDNSNIYAMHAYVISDDRARLHQSSSHFRKSADSEFRNLTGRANRLLHWDDILYFKNMGLHYYDFGGWYGGQTDPEKLAINQFKESFGGEKQREYTYLIPVTSLGKAAVFLQKLTKKKK